MTQVIVLNGGSSSGKSSIARALQDILPKVWLTFGVDALIEALPGRGDDPRSGLVLEADGTVTVKPEFRALEDVWYAGLAFMAHNSASLILDEVLLTGGVGQRRLQAALNGLDLFWVGVHCDPNVAAAREMTRSDRVQGMAMAQAVAVHRGVTYDIEVDTTGCSASECASRIALHVTS
jgi:chloramphenicol 3-O phosphotransferase